MMNLNTVRKEKNLLQWLEDRGLTSAADMEKAAGIKKAARRAAYAAKKGLTTAQFLELELAMDNFRSN
jgi:hypothetical protein